MISPDELDNVRVTLADKTYDIRVSLKLLSDIEEKFGAVSAILNQMEKSAFGYNKLVDLLEILLAGHKTISKGHITSHLMEHGITEINQAVFQVLARFSLGKDYLQKIMGEPILGEQRTQAKV